MVKEQYISFETAKLAKERGFIFDGGFGYLGKDGEYCQNNNKIWRKLDDFYPACTQSLLERWLRENHNKVIEIFATERGYVYNICKTNGTNLANSGYKGPDGTGAWNTYEQAKEAGLQDALKLILMYNDVIK